MAATLKFRLTGGASNTNPNASLGGVMSSTEVSATPMNNLFDNVSPAEAEAGDVEFRAIDIYNSGDATATEVKIYMSTETSSPDTQIDLGYDSAGAHASDWSGPSISNEGDTPADSGGGNISFSHYTSLSKLTLPDIPSGQAVRVWLKRIVSTGAGNTADDQGTITVEYA